MSVEEALQDLRAGKLLVIVDDKERENEGDLVIAAEYATKEKVNFLIKKGGGLVCVPMKKERLERLSIPLMVENKENTESTKCKFTVSVDYKEETTTGISASDRAATIQALTDEKTRPEDFARPGHIFPLQYEEGGIKRRAGHTEAAIDLCELAGLKPVAVICEILNEEGDAMKVEELQNFSEKHNLHMISIEELKEYKKAL
jgi:3,4-dihydroxy 2-butanone 4-phosphate synthase/GTP cyclohydrolase II